MTDEERSDGVESLVDDAIVGDGSDWPVTLPSAGATTDTEPTTLVSAEASRLVPFDLTTFLNGKAMWAANYFVLWPIGLALTVDVGTGPVDADAWCGDSKVHVEHRFRRKKLACRGARVVDEVTNLHVRHWTYPEGELSETIDQEAVENQADYEVFLGFVRERVLAMKPEERHIVLGRLGKHSIAAADQILVAS